MERSTWGWAHYAFQVQWEWFDKQFFIDWQMFDIMPNILHQSARLVADGKDYSKTHADLDSWMKANMPEPWVKLGDWWFHE